MRAGVQPWGARIDTLGSFAGSRRVQRFQPEDCGHYQVCGPRPEEECG